MRISIAVRSLLSVLAVTVLLPAVSGCGDSTSDDLETATDLVEQWTAAWNNKDRDALAAIFTEDAVVEYTGAHSRFGTSSGRDEIAREAVMESSHLHYGEVTVTDDGSFTCSGTFEGAGFEFASRLTFELDGDLISHLVHHDELTGQ
jgi:ketosteroid isomerase-like protein